LGELLTGLRRVELFGHGFGFVVHRYHQAWISMPAMTAKTNVANSSVTLPISYRSTARNELRARVAALPAGWGYDIGFRYGRCRYRTSSRVRLAHGCRRGR
jgi:hypothetical protein